MRVDDDAFVAIRYRPLLQEHVNQGFGPRVDTGLIPGPVERRQKSAVEKQRVVSLQCRALRFPRTVRDLGVQRCGEQGQVSKPMDVLGSELLGDWVADGPMIRPFLGKNVLDRVSTTWNLRLIRRTSIFVLDCLEEHP